MILKMCIIKMLNIEIKNIYRIYYKMNKILDVMEDIKQNITDKEYKTIMDSFMEIHKTKKTVIYYRYYQ